jgi:hypothetical protein
MPTINPATVSDGETIDASDLNNPIATITDLVNGDLDSDNLADSAVSSAKLATGAVTPEKLLSGTGTSWVWQDWSPTYSGISVGNGTVTAKYTQIGKTVIAYWELVCGTTTSIVSNATITLPVSASTRHGSGYTKVGDGMVEDSGSALLQIEAYTLASASVAQIRYPSIATHSGTVYVELTGTVPITEASGDSWGISFVYEAA